MAARNRPRAGVVKDESADAHEERNMWNQIVADIKKLKQINAKAAEISTQIVEMEAVMARVDPETGNGRSAVISSSLHRLDRLDLARSRSTPTGFAPGNPRTTDVVVQRCRFVNLLLPS